MFNLLILMAMTDGVNGLNVQMNSREVVTCSSCSYVNKELLKSETYEVGDENVNSFPSVVSDELESQLSLGV